MSTVEGTSLFADRPLPHRAPDWARATLEVAARPGDLDAHLARLDACGDVAQVFGALVDLFIGIDPSATDARAEALAHHLRALSAPESDALTAALATGLGPTDPVPDAPDSVLTAGVVGVPVALLPVHEPVHEPAAETAAAPEAAVEPTEPSPAGLQLPAAGRPAPWDPPPPATTPRSGAAAVALVGAGALVALWRLRKRRRRHSAGGSGG